MTDMEVDPPKTPSKKDDMNLREAPDTPFKTRVTNGPQFRTGDLESRRTAVVEDLGEIPVVSLNYFLENAELECITSIEVKQILDDLKAKKLYTTKWTGFPDEPSKVSADETDVFAPLEAIFKAVCEVPRGTRKATVRMGYVPNSSPMSERANATRPDAHLELEQGDVALAALAALEADESKTKNKSWANIVLACQFKKHATLAKVEDVRNAFIQLLISISHFVLRNKQNHRKIIWDGFHILRNDPCRQFTFGFTIENTSARMWYFSRSHLMVSEPFNFIKVRQVA